MTALILASASPRRRELLRRLGLDYAVQPADIDETPRPGEAPAELALRLATTKAHRIAERADPGAIVFAADTVVARGSKLYGKPIDPDDATAMLRELSGRGHRVITGVAVARGAESAACGLTSRVLMRAMTDEEISAYVASGDPLDKAGAYAIQHEGFRPVAVLRGCRCNVVGFPIAVVATLLQHLGIQPPVSAEVACPYGAYTRRRCRPG